MGPSIMREYFLERFKFGEETGIDLPGEVRGLTDNLNGTQAVEFDTASFGQGVAITPIQMIRALGTLANTKNLITFMIQASERIRSFGAGRPVWYCNRTIREKLRLGIVEKISNNLSWETVEGKRVMVFDDIPVRRTDALLNTETVVS